jgi:hypothetical protein
VRGVVVSRSDDMVSLNNMVKRISGLTSKDLTEWEEGFVESILERTDNGTDTSMLSEKQILVVERIFNKHFAG